jgi:hypothetical protein
MITFIHHLRHRLGWITSDPFELQEDGTMVYFCVICGRFTFVRQKTREEIIWSIE